MALHFKSAAEMSAFFDATHAIKCGLHPHTWKHDGIGSERARILWGWAEAYCAYWSRNGYCKQFQDEVDRAIDDNIRYGFKWD